MSFGGGELAHLLAVKFLKLKETDLIGGQVQTHPNPIGSDTDFPLTFGKAICLAAAHFRRQVAVDHRYTAFAHLQFCFEMEYHAPWKSHQNSTVQQPFS